MADKQSIFLRSKWSLKTIRAYYGILQKFPNYKNTYTGQRFSIYDIDKNVTYNMCIILPNSINGYVYIDTPSIWHKMSDTSELTIFNPEEFIK